MGKEEARTERHFRIEKAPVLDKEERIKELRPSQLLRDAAHITSGMTCVDLGSGTGTFSFPMALCVGNEGVVYAVDDSAEMLQHIRDKNPPPNLKLVHSDAGKTGLRGQIADFCLLSFILHEVNHPDILVAEAFRLLKPEGRVLIVEWKAHRSSPGPNRRKRVSRREAERLLEQAGFSGLKYLSWSENFYAATANKTK